MPLPAAPPPRPVYGPPGYMAMPGFMPRPVYGPPMYGALGPGGAVGSYPMAAMAAFGQLPIPRPAYGAPPPQPSVFNSYSNAVNHGLPRYQGAPPPPPPAAVPPRVEIQPSIEAYSSHSISGSLDSYGPPAAGPVGAPSSGAPFSNAYSSASSGSQSGVPAPPPSSGASPSQGLGQDQSRGPQSQGAAPSSYGPPPAPSGPGAPGASEAFDFNSINNFASFGAPESPGQQPDNYFKRDTDQAHQAQDQGRDAGSSSRNARKYARAFV